MAAYASLAYQESTYDTANGALVEDGDTIESDREELPTEPSSSGCAWLHSLGYELYVDSGMPGHYIWIGKLAQGVGLLST